MSRSIVRSITAILLFAGASAAMAVPLNVTASLPGIGYFEASVLHTSSPSNPMVGTIFARFDNASGTYDPATGDLSISFTIGGSTAATMTGSGFNFDAGSGLLTTTASVRLEIFHDFSADGYPAGSVYNVEFTPGIQCCTRLGTNIPNTLNQTGPDTFVMTLWGAGGLISGPAGAAGMVGMDVQVELQPVPYGYPLAA